MKELVPQVQFAETSQAAPAALSHCGNGSAVQDSPATLLSPDFTSGDLNTLAWSTPTTSVLHRDAAGGVTRG